MRIEPRIFVSARRVKTPETAPLSKLGGRTVPRVRMSAERRRNIVDQRVSGALAIAALDDTELRREKSLPLFK